MYLRILLFCTIATPLVLAQNKPSEVRPGIYKCFTYGASTNPPIYVGALDMKASATYEYAKKTGTYKYDAGTSTINWMSGPAQESNFKGAYEFDGKSYKI